MTASTAPIPTTTPEPPHGLPARTVAGTLGSAWVLVAAGETVLGDLDAFSDVATVAGGSARIAAAGLLHCAAGVLLAYAAAGLSARLHGRPVGRSAAWLVLVSAVCLGAFGLFHLLLIETAAPGLEADAMNAFLARLSEAPGWWSVPVALLALVGMPALTVACLSLARAGQVRWWGPAAVALATVVHALPGLEVVSHWTAAAGLAVMATDLLRREPGRTR